MASLCIDAQGAPVKNKTCASSVFSVGSTNLVAALNFDPKATTGTNPFSAIYTVNDADKKQPIAIVGGFLSASDVTDALKNAGWVQKSAQQSDCLLVSDSDKKSVRLYTIAFWVAVGLLILGWSLFLWRMVI